MRVTRQVELVAKKTGKSTSTIWRWVKAGCDLNSHASIKQFLQGNRLRQNPNTIRKTESVDEAIPDLNSIDLAPIGPRGAQWALKRLEEVEERAHARLQRAIEIGTLFQVKSCQEFYLRASESLRRLDLAVEVERRHAEEQVSLRQVEAVAATISGWLRLSFERFLSAESPGLMAIKDLGAFKFSAIEQFRGILHATVKASLRTDPPIPDWAAVQVSEGWNVPNL